MSLTRVTTVPELRATVADWRREGARVAIVPTMGALHEGHLGLVRAALAAADRAVVSIFVNPKQFNNAADLASYPRSDKADALMLAAAGAHLLYAPDVETMYPQGFATTISVSGISSGLCGAFRPGHFDGVATVVTKLFLQSGADCAFFGEKDFQQLAVIRHLVQDLNIPIEIIAFPTVREVDGLALSSRNRRLTPEQRLIAPRLSEQLFSMAAELTAGAPCCETLTHGMAHLRAVGFREIEYLELCNEEDLQPSLGLDQPARLLVAAWLGDVRLIDNIRVTAPAAIVAAS